MPVGLDEAKFSSRPHIPTLVDVSLLVLKPPIVLFRAAFFLGSSTAFLHSVAPPCTLSNDYKMFYMRLSVCNQCHISPHLQYLIWLSTQRRVEKRIAILSSSAFINRIQNIYQCCFKNYLSYFQRRAFALLSKDYYFSPPTLVIGQL